MCSAAQTRSDQAAGQQQLSTYGIGGELKRGEWQAIGRELLRRAGRMRAGQVRERCRLRLGVWSIAKADIDRFDQAIEIAEKPARRRPGAIECDEALFAAPPQPPPQTRRDRNVPHTSFFRRIAP